MIIQVVYIDLFYKILVDFEDVLRIVINIRIFELVGQMDKLQKVIVLDRRQGVKIFLVIVSV